MTLTVFTPTPTQNICLLFIVLILQTLYFLMAVISSILSFRVEYFLRGCVLETLRRDAECNMDDIEKVMSRDEVRKGLLDSISVDYCGKKISVLFVISEGSKIYPLLSWRY